MLFIFSDLKWCAYVFECDSLIILMSLKGREKANVIILGVSFKKTFLKWATSYSKRK